MKTLVSVFRTVRPITVIYRDRQRKSAQLTKTRWEREIERERIFFDSLLGGPKINVLEEEMNNISF